MNFLKLFIVIALVVFVFGWTYGCSVHIKNDNIPDVKITTESEDE